MRILPMGFTARVLVPYILFAALWILLSDQVLAVLFDDPRLLTHVQTYKGLAFIGVTAILLYFLLQRELAKRKVIQDEKADLRQRILNIVESISDGFITLDHNWCIVYVNRRAAEMLHRDNDELLGRTLWDVYPDAINQPYYPVCQQVMDSGRPEAMEFFFHPWRRWFELHVYPADPGISLFFQDISERKRAGMILASEKEILEMIAQGEPLAVILHSITHNVEATCQGTLCSILLLDKDGVHLRHGAAPSLPLAYMQAIDGEKIGPAAGSCGTAAYRKMPVYVSDIVSDPLWRDYRELALQHGLQACWSTPIKSGEGAVLGTFAVYYSQPRNPSPEELAMIEHITHLAGIAIERRHDEERMARQMQMLQALYDVAHELRRDLEVNQLARHIVEKCVERFGAQLAWIGSTAADGRVVPVTHYPIEADYMHDLEVRWDDTPEGQGPTGRAIRSGEPQVTKNFATDIRASHWRDAALAAGISCSAAFPLIGQEGPIGALNIYAVDKDFFTPERVEFFMAYARLAAAKIENARLYEQLRDSANELRRLSQKLFRTQETERHHIARELHDEIGQILTVIKLNLQSLQNMSEAPVREAADTHTLLEDSIHSVDQLVSKVRNLSLDLRPSILDDLGLAPALRWYTQRQTKFLGLEISLQVPADLPRLNAEIETACFRIVQEAITNVARHAHAAQVQVKLQLDAGQVVLQVQDDGSGFDPRQAQQHGAVEGGFGLLGMAERAQLVGGTLQIKSTPTQGTRIEALLPLTLAEVPVA